MQLAMMVLVLAPLVAPTLLHVIIMLLQPATTVLAMAQAAAPMSAPATTMLRPLAMMVHVFHM